MKNSNSWSRILRGAAILVTLAAGHAVAAPTADGRIVYNANSTTPQHRGYTASTNTFGAQTATLVGGTPNFIVNRAAPTRNERIVAYQTNANPSILYVYRWDGTSWINETSAAGGWGGTVTVGGAGVNGRRFDVAYEKTSGRAVVVYSTNGTGGTAEMAYRIWDGSAWTAATTIQSLRFTGSANWIKLAPRVNGTANDIMLAAVDTSRILTTFLWNGTTWSGEPGTAHSTAVNQSAAAGDLHSMDIAAESASGNFLLVWSDGTNLSWKEYTTAWGTASTRARNAWQITAAGDPDPASDRILVGYIPNTGGSVYASVWNGTTMAAERTISTVGATPAVNTRRVAVGYVRSGTTRAGVVTFQDNTTTYTRVSYSYTTDDSTFAAAVNANVTGPTQAKRWMDIDVDPLGSDTLMLTFSDASSDLWAKRLVFAAPSTFTWSNADGGTAFVANLTLTTIQNFSFTYDRYFDVAIANGTDPGNASISQGQTAALDAFTLQTSAATATVAAVVVNIPSNATALSAISIQSTSSCSGGTTYGTLNAPAAGNNTVNLTTNITATASSGATNYYVCATAASVGADTLVTGNVASVTATGFTSTDNDTGGPTITVTPPAITIGNGTDPASTTIPPGGGETPVDAFTLTAPATVNVSTLTVTLAAGTRVGLAQLRILSASNCTGTVYATVTSFASDAVAISTWTTTLQATTAGTAAYVCVTPLSHAAMPAPPGADYGVTASVTGVTAAGYAQAGSDSGSATVTIDNSSPADATITSTTTPAAGQITVDWTNPAADFGSYVVVLRNTASITDRPAEGTATYTAGGTIGTSTIACVGNIATCTASGLASGTRYYLKIFPRDANDNWAVGAETSAVTLDARTTPVSLTGSAPTCVQANLSASYTGDTPTSNNAVTFARSSAAGGPFTNLVACTSVSGGTNPRTCSDTTVAASTTYYYRATFSDADGIVGNASVDSGAVAVPVCGATLAATAGTMPAAADVTAGSSGTIVGRVVLTASTATATLDSLAISNDGTAVAGADIATLSLFNDATGAYVAAGVWNSATSHYEFKGLALDVAVGSPVTLRVVLGISIGATATRTFSMRVDVPADVTVVSPGYVSNTATIFGNAFTITAGTTAGSTDTRAPMVSIINPSNGAVVSPNNQYKVQIRVFNPSAQNGIAGITANSVQLSTDNGATFPLTATQNTSYNSGTPTVTGTVYEVLVTGPAAGSYTLRARASNGVPLTVVSEPLQITVGATGRGDGNLLVRDNSAQLCTDCHALQTHSSEAVGTKYGAWAVTCRDCHAPHGTRNIMLVQETITPPSVNGVQTAKNVGFVKTTGDSNAAGWDGVNGKPTATGSFVNSDNSGPCQVCHTRTQSGGAVARWRNTGNADTHYTAAAGTQACTNCHAHGNGFGGGESTGGASCSGCHAAIKGMMAGTDGAGTGSQPSKHSLVGFADSSSDVVPAAGDWGSAGITSLDQVPAAQRSCVNMCHSDHPHDLTSPALATHDSNLYLDPSTQATRGNGSANRTSSFRVKTDFDPTADAGMCTKCHSKPIAAGRTTIAEAAYGASAHDFTSTATPAFTWQYTLHDGGTTQRNCTKCHTSRTEGNTPGVSGTGVTAVHGTSDPSLLAGTKNPAGTAAGFVCYNCHGSSAAPAAGAQGNRSNKDIQTQIAKVGNHPANADAVHDSAAELANASFGNALGGAARHASCMDCHEPHQARAGTHAVTTNVAGPPLEGAWGAQLSTNPAFWTAPAAGNFTKKAIVAGTDAEATLCFKCHSSFYAATLPTTPSGAYAGTDTAREFNPNNVGNFAGTWATGETAGGFHPVLASAGSNLGAINMANLVTTNFAWRTTGARNLMTCTDCHESNSAADPNGPHGSTAGFILRGPNTTWNNTMVATSTGMPTGAFCANCHSSTYANSRYGTQHTSRTDHRVNCWNCHARVPHGGPRPGILVAGAGAAAGVGGTIAGWDTAAPYWAGGTTDRLYIVSYPANNTTTWGQSNCGCNGTGH